MVKGTDVTECLRQEKKYLIDLPGMYALGRTPSSLLSEDPHSRSVPYPILNPNHAVPEAKFPHFLPDYLKRPTHRFSELDPSVDLYRLSRTASIYFSF